MLHLKVFGNMNFAAKLWQQEVFVFIYKLDFVADVNVQKKNL